MASHLNYIGDLQKGRPTVLMIPGGMATSPAVYEGIGETLVCQSAVIDWSRSPGPWDRCWTKAARKCGFHGPVSPPPWR